MKAEHLAQSFSNGMNTITNALMHAQNIQIIDGHFFNCDHWFNRYLMVVNIIT